MTMIHRMHDMSLFKGVLETVFLYIVAICFLTLPEGSVMAYEITQTNAENKGDFVLEESKKEISIGAGETAVEQIGVVNRTGEERTFFVEIEDIRGGAAENGADLLGDVDGPYPLRKFVTPELKTFTLKQGERMLLPITITVPKDIEPGGRYGSVIISSTPSGSATSTGVKIISRLGALFLVRIKGEVQESGSLEDFLIVPNKTFFIEGRPNAFELHYRNSGTVHANPYGTITVKNIAGAEIAAIEIKPFYALPDALRYRKIAWDHPVLAGRYTATIEMHPGFGDEVFSKQIVFWIFPTKFVLGAVGVLIFLMVITRWIRNNFTIRKKT